MFKSFYYVKNIFKTINEDLKLLYNYKNQLINLKQIYKKEKLNLEQILIKDINILNNKINKINLLINNKINFLESDINIEFDSDFCFLNSSGFNYNNTKRMLHSNVLNSNNIKFEKITFDNYTKVLKIEFEKFEKINFFQFSFLDTDLNPIIPINILYNDFKENNLFIDNWNNKIKKESFNGLFNNTFFIDPKETKILYFQFENNININESNINFYYNEYDINNEIIYKIPIKELNGFLLNKDTYEDYISLDFYYSLDSKEFKKLYFENNIAKNIFDETKNIESLYIKIKRGTLQYNQDNKKIDEEEIILNSKSIKQDEISFLYNQPQSFNIIIDNNFYLTLNKQIPDLFNKRIDGLIEINNSYIKEINNLNPLQKLSLTNANNIKIYNENNYPLFYIDKDRYLYLPKCFAEKDFNIIYKVETIKDIYADKDFTPICFNFNLNFI